MKNKGYAFLGGGGGGEGAQIRCIMIMGDVQMANG